MIKKMFPLLLLFLYPLLYSENASLVEIYIKNFEKGSPDVKYQVLLDAADTGIGGMDLLYHKAILYVLDRIDLQDTDDILVQIAAFALNQIHIKGYSRSLDKIWELFLKTGNTELRVNILAVLGDIGKDNPDTIVAMNRWLDSQNVLFLTGKTINQQVIIACVQALGKIGDPSSFLPLFTAMIQQYSEPVTSAAEKVLDMIKGDLGQLYMNVIIEGRMQVKKQALLKGIASTKLRDQEKCRIAESALSLALAPSPSEQDAEPVSLEIRYIAAEFLSEKKWLNAAPLMIEHFNQAIYDLDNGKVLKSFLIQAIRGLGNMKTHEAAKRLSLYLEHINSFTESGKAYDEQIVLAVIYALGNIGDRIATSALLYSRYLLYSQTIKKAAENALKDLR